MKHVAARQSPQAISSISLKLKRIPLKMELILVSVIFAFVPYAFFALKLFPNGDSYNGYVHLYYYAISSLLNGIIPYWDPMPACGWPFFYSFLASGMLEPFFAISVLLGKILTLNVFQIYMTWIVLRTIPFLIGMFWLLKLHCRHSTIALLGTAFIYYTIVVCLLHDGVFYVLYLPLVLACGIYFYRSLRRKKPSFTAFYGAILFLSISLLSGNPSYICLVIFILVFCSFLCGFKQVSIVAKVLFSRIKLPQLVLSFFLVSALLSPAVVIWNHYQKGEHFAYQRVHQAKKNTGRMISGFLHEPLDYVEVSLENSPMRRGRELGTALFPFFYNLFPYGGDGTLYFGYLPILGILAGTIFWRGRIFLIYGLSALCTVFLMTWSANEIIQLTRPLLPFLKVMNQRQLLYPAFLIFATVAGCLGLRLLLSYRILRKISVYFTFSKILAVGFVFLAVGAIFIFATNMSISEDYLMLNEKVIRLSTLFLAALISITFLARQGAVKPPVFRIYLIFLFFIYLADGVCYYRFFYLVRNHDFNTKIFASSHMLRDRLDLNYRPFRSVLLPCVLGGDQSLSVVHQLNLRSALPAYFVCDASFSSKRYYELISLLSAEKLKHVLAISSPIVKVYKKEITLPSGDDALGFLKQMDDGELRDTVVLQDKSTKRLIGDEALIQRAFVGRPSAYKYFPSNWPYAGKIEDSFYTQLFDRVVDIPIEYFEEESHGIYHHPMLRVRLPKQETPGFADSTDLLSRYFFSDLPMAADINGVIHYLSLDKNTMLKFVPREGFLLEYQGPWPVLPKKLYIQDKRDVPLSGARVVDFGPNQIVIETDTQDPTVLSYADLYDTNWRATIDGKPTDIWIANYAFKAVSLPRGKHRVTFSYEVRYLSLAIAAYFLCILFCGIYFISNYSVGKP